MNKWYIGPARAIRLLRYAEGVLGKYAYQIPKEDYIKFWNLLRTQIPLWEEERRGPRDPKTGLPLYSEELYKKYIDWWIYQLVVHSLEGKESKMKGSWIGDIFGRDPARRVFGARLKAADVPPFPKDVSVRPDFDLDIGAIAAPALGEFAAELDRQTHFGPADKRALMSFAADRLAAYSSQVWPPSVGPDIRAKVRVAIYDWLGTYLDSWMVSKAGMGSGKDWYEGIEEPGPRGWRYQLVDPNTTTPSDVPVPIYALAGPKQDKVRDALAKLLWYILATVGTAEYKNAGGTWGTQYAELEAYHAQFPDFPADTYPYMQNTPARSPDLKWPFGKTAGFVGDAGLSQQVPASDLMKQYGGYSYLRNVLIIYYDLPQSAIDDVLDKVDEALSGTRIAVGENGYWDQWESAVSIITAAVDRAVQQNVTGASSFSWAGTSPSPRVIFGAAQKPGT